MKRIKKFFLGNIKPLIAFILGLIISGTTVYAAIIFASSDVSYDNTQSGLQSTNVQDALDELNTKANFDSFWLEKYKTWAGTPTYYHFEYGPYPPTTEDPTTPPSGKNLYLGLYADNQYGLCIIRNGTQHCFRYNNWIAEAKHVQEVFSDSSCNVNSSYVSCYADDFDCHVKSNGYVACNYYGTTDHCEVHGDGQMECRSMY